MSSNIDYGKPPWQPTYMCSTLENFKVTLNQMDKVKHTIIIVSFYFNFMNLMKVPEETVESCMIYTEEHWLVYQSHFFLVNFLTIQVLQTENHAFALNRFTEKVIEAMSNYDYFIAVKIKENFLSKGANPSKHLLYNATVRHGEVTDNKKKIKIKTFSSGSFEGYVIIAWHPSVLHQFLDQDHQIVLPKIRATYAIQFIFSTKHLCKTIKTEMDNILRRLWIEFNVVNVIAQTTCSCDTSEVYIYRPFVKTDNLWGLTEYYHLKDITSNFGVITNPLTNFNQFPLKVSIFEQFPIATRKLPRMLRNNPIYKNLTWSKGFGGFDGLVLGTLAEHLNFDMVPFGTTTEANYGVAFANGTTTGSLHDVIHRKVVYSANTRTIINAPAGIEFTIPYVTNEFCVVVPKALKLPNWAILLKCFDQLSWTSIALTVATSGIFWHLVGPSTDFVKQSWQIFSILIGIPTEVVPVLHQAFFLVGCMIFNLVILGTIQGVLFTSFTKTIYYKDVSTFEEVVQLGLPMATSRYTFMYKDSDIMKRLKTKEVDPNDIFDLVAFQRNIITLDTKLFLMIITKSKYVDDDGQPLLHVVNECVSTFKVATTVPKGSAFLNVFDNIIIKLHESGLTWKWFNDMLDSIVAEKMISISKKRKSLKSFSLHDTESAFYIIILGLGCSVVVFLGEILHKTFKKKLPQKYKLVFFDQL
jgi:hypothetical protein